MRPEVLHSEFLEILGSSFVRAPADGFDSETLSLTETEMFRLWNVLGEELGIDLSLATSEQRAMLFEACDNGRKFSPKDFGSLLWLVYYGDTHYQ